MCLVLEIGMLIFGIIALITGKFTLTRNKVVYGVPARIIGVIMILPLPLGLLVAFVIIGALVAQGRFTPGNIPIAINFIEPAIIFGCFLFAMIVAAMNAV